MKKINQIFSNISIIIIDSSIVFSISLLLDTLLTPYVFIEILLIFIITYYFYLIIFYSMSGQTPAMFLLNKKLVSKNNSLTFKNIIIREILLKLLIGYIIPYVVIKLCGYSDFYLITIFIFVCFIPLNLIFFLIKNKSWWDTFANTKIELINSKKQNLQKMYVIILLFLISSFLIIRHNHNSTFSSRWNFIGFNYPLNIGPYPNDSRVKDYVNHIKNKSLNYKDYIFKLFDKYDIVILCERLHPEATQWDMIYEIVSDKRFINNVGNIFTEYGCHDKQAMVDSLINNNYQNDSILTKATYKILPYITTTGAFWDIPNFVYFLRKLNLLNNNLPDSMKIREYFTKQTSWDSIQNFEKWIKITNMDYDSVMAVNVINNFRRIQKNEKRKKCLVITNYTHAFNLNKIPEKLDFITEASYIFNEYPKNTANIFINSVRNKYRHFIYSPIQNGAWDKAFFANNNLPVGFDLEGSPFGEDKFDFSTPLPLGNNYSIKFKDVFTGFVFYNPINEFKTNVILPKMVEGFEDEYKRRKSILKEPINSDNLFFFIDPKNIPLNKTMYIFTTIIYFIDKLLLVIIVSLAFLISTYHILRISFKKNKMA